jgi:hypothetical protein
VTALDIHVELDERDRECAEDCHGDDRRPARDPGPVAPSEDRRGPSSRRAPHDTARSLAGAEGQGGEHVGDEVQEQDLERQDGQRRGDE